MNWLDKSIGFFSPERGLKRARARAATQLMAGYEGASTGRRTDGWFTAGGSANAEISGAAGRLRNRVRDLVRNNAHLRKALRVTQNNIIGYGITPRADTGDRELNKRIDAAFKDWARACDADGQLDFYGLQSLIVRTERMAGECLVRFRTNKAAKSPIPLELQVLEPEYIDSTKQYFADKDGKFTILGVEHDRNDKRSGYWLFNRHPGEVIGVNLKGFISELVPANEILHVYYKERPGQVRGITDYSAIVTNLRDMDEYADAERVRKKTEACVALIVETPEGESSQPMAPASTAANGTDRIETFQPGMVEYTRPGEVVKFNNPQSNGGYREYKVTELHEIAAGAGVMYEQISGDISQVNFSSYRAGNLEFQGDVNAYRWQLLVPMCLDPIWRRFIDYLVIAGLLKEPNYGVIWTPPPFQSIDPEKEANANRSEVRAGRKTWDESVVECGFDPERQMEQIEARNKLLDERGIILDIDPRYVNDRGQLHGTAATQSGEAPPPPDGK